MNIKDTESLSFRHINLYLKEYCQAMQIDEREIESLLTFANVKMYRDEHEARLIIKLHADIYGFNHPEKHIIRYPVDWLEAFKERWAPAFIRDRWPVKYKEITASLHECYPGLKPAIQSRAHCFQFTIRDNEASPVW